MESSVSVWAPAVSSLALREVSGAVLFVRLFFCGVYAYLPHHWMGTLVRILNLIRYTLYSHLDIRSLSFVLGISHSVGVYWRLDVR